LPACSARTVSSSSSCGDAPVQVEAEDNPFLRRCTLARSSSSRQARRRARGTPTKARSSSSPARGQIVLRYADGRERLARNVAGVVNEAGNVMGLMPHPSTPSTHSLGSAGRRAPARGSRRRRRPTRRARGDAA
jgi:phosphoribosylformylglycinamidine synthase